LERVKAETLGFAKIELEPSMEGRQMIMILAPK
jgi:translation initiation factor IF-3